MRTPRITWWEWFIYNIYMGQHTYPLPSPPSQTRSVGPQLEIGANRILPTSTARETKHTHAQRQPRTFSAISTIYIFTSCGVPSYFLCTSASETESALAHVIKSWYEIAYVWEWRIWAGNTVVYTEAGVRWPHSKRESKRKEIRKL